MTYKEFIDNILNIRGRFGLKDVYKERHHIIPRCMNGLDNIDNLIDLTAEEHFRAHWLLANENPDNISIQYALIFTVVSNKHNKNRYKPTKEEKEYLRKLNIVVTSNMRKDRHVYYHKDTHERKYFKDNVSDDYLPGYPPEYISPVKGKLFSEEHKKHLSESKKGKYIGKKWFNNGKEEILSYNQPEGYIPGRLPFSEEICRNMSIGLKNKIKVCSNETRKKLSDSKKGKHVYNNGIISIRAEKCPNGFVKGFIKKEKKSCHFYTNGIITKKINNGDVIPDGFYLGMAKNEKLQNRQWWTNGKENHWCKECPGEDFYLGKA